MSEAKEKKLKSNVVRVELADGYKLTISFDPDDVNCGVVVNLRCDHDWFLAFLRLKHPQISPLEFWEALAGKSRKEVGVDGDDHYLRLDTYNAGVYRCDNHNGAGISMRSYDREWRSKLAAAVKEQVLPEEDAMPELINGDVVVSATSSAFVFVDGRFLDSHQLTKSDTTIYKPERIYRNGELIWERKR